MSKLIVLLFILFSTQLRLFGTFAHKRLTHVIIVLSELVIVLLCWLKLNSKVLVMFPEATILLSVYGFMAGATV